MTPLRRRMLDYMRLKNYSNRTIRSYICYVKHFAIYLGKSPELATLEDIRAYLLYLTVESGSSQSHLNGTYSGIKVLFEGVLGRAWDFIQLPRSRREKTLPAVLSAEQAQALVNAPSNLKHRTILQLMYATGHTNLSTTNRYLHISATHGEVPDLLAGIEAHHETVF